MFTVSNSTLPCCTTSNSNLLKLKLLFLYYCYYYYYSEISPETMVTGPKIVLSFCLVKFRIRHRIRVDFPTFGGPTTAIRIGGGSTGVLSTTGI